MPNYTFKKAERLKSKKIIDSLFQEGQSFGAYPLRIVWVPVEGNAYPVQCTVSVSKKRFPKAVDRNRVKRQLREAWRLNKHHLYAALSAEEQYAIMLLYTGKEQAPQHEIEQSVQRIIKKFLRKTAPATTEPKK